MPATLQTMPRAPLPEGESKKDKSEPVRLDRTLLAVVRAVAPLEGLTAPAWIEKQIRSGLKRTKKNAAEQLREILDQITDTD